MKKNSPAKPKPSPKKSSLGAVLGATLVFMAGALLFFAVSVEQQPFLKKVTDFNMASETHRKIFAECLALHKQLDELKFPHVFNEIQINLIDPLPSKQQIASALNSCLTQNPKSPFALQGEVFSSEYEGKDGDVIVIQLNFFDKTGNKVMELNHHWKTSEFEPSEEASNDVSTEQAQEKPATPSSPNSPQNSFEEITEEGNTDLDQKID